MVRELSNSSCDIVIPKALAGAANPGMPQGVVTPITDLCASFQLILVWGSLCITRGRVWVSHSLAMFRQ